MYKSVFNLNMYLSQLNVFNINLYIFKSVLKAYERNRKAKLVV